MAKVVYHAGDFSKKSESLVRLMGHRNTGYFGTGYYFTKDWKKCASLDNGERPLYSLDVSNYNLITGTLELHNILKYIDNALYVYKLLDIDTNKFEDICDAIDRFKEEMGKKSSDFPDVLDDLYQEFLDTPNGYAKLKEDYLEDILYCMEDLPEFQELFSLLNSDEYDYYEIKNSFDKVEIFTRKRYLENLEETKVELSYARDNMGIDKDDFDRAIEQVYEDLKPYYVRGLLRPILTDIEYSDSIPTRFLKKLGYEGVYPDDECDNTTYGGVIFDLDKAKDVKLLSKESRNYKESISMNKLRFFEDLYDNSNFDELWDKVQNKINQYNIDNKMDFIKEELKKEVDKFNNKEFGEDAEVLFKARVDTIFHRVGLVEKESEPLAFAIYDIMVGEDEDD